MARTFPELPDWSFGAGEMSADFYRAVGHDPAGRSVEASGLDPEALIEKCRQAALEIMAETRKPSDSSRS
jgi:hypothetical protein